MSSSGLELANAILRKRVARLESELKDSRAIVTQVNIGAEQRRERDDRLKRREREFAVRVAALKKAAQAVAEFEAVDTDDRPSFSRALGNRNGGKR